MSGRRAALGRAVRLTVLPLTLLLAGCCPAALPSTTLRTPGTDVTSPAGVSGPMAAAPSVSIAAFVAVLEVDANGASWALSGTGDRTRLDLQRVSGGANPTATSTFPTTGPRATSAGGASQAALRPGERVYVTGDWSADGTLVVASIQPLPSARR